MTNAVVHLRDLPEEQVQPLLVASEAEGYRFVRRVVSEWSAGTNTFSDPGEALLGSFLEARLVGICGLMRDPYEDEPGLARLRNLYVLPERRGLGIGSVLVRRVIELASQSFRLLRLRAGTPQAVALYERLGFTRTSEVPNCTHVLPLAFSVGRSGQGGGVPPNPSLQRTRFACR